jgi:uncharacterized BrkB/YihY/UPF0761 family membrane protein
MREILNRLWTSPRWFIGTVTVLFFLAMFFWFLINPEHYTNTINHFLEGIWTLVKFFLTLVFIIAGIMMIFGWRPFKQKKANNSNH